MLRPRAPPEVSPTYTFLVALLGSADTHLHPRYSRADGEQRERVLVTNTQDKKILQGKKRPNKGQRWLDSQELQWHHSWYISPLTHKFSNSCILSYLKVSGLIFHTQRGLEVSWGLCLTYRGLYKLDVKTDTSCTDSSSLFQAFIHIHLCSHLTCGRYHSWLSACCWRG